MNKFIKKLKIFCLFLLFCFSFYYSILYFINKDNKFINYLIQDKINDISNNKRLSLEIIDKITNKSGSDPVSLLTFQGKNYENEISEIPVIKKEKVPLVYIYNTHQTEEYSKKDLELYNITPNVLVASYMLEEQLSKYNIKSLVEERNPQQELKKKKLAYNKSYSITRNYLDETIKNNPSINFYFDLHRDSISKKQGTIEINDKSYAKVMFVIGKANKNSNLNIKNANTINSYITNKYPGLSRGIFYRNTSVFNQDISENCFLIEIGGQDNTIDEIYNSIQVLAEAIANYIGDNNE